MQKGQSKLVWTSSADTLGFGQFSGKEDGLQNEGSPPC